MFKVISDLAKVNEATQEILAKLKDFNLSNDCLQDIRLSFEEALINAIKHGNKFNKNFSVDCNLTVQGNSIIISVRDQGQGYDYNKIKNPTLDENLERKCGRGVFLIKKLMDNVSFNKAGNEIIMQKKISRHDACRGSR